MSCLQRLGKALAGALIVLALLASDAGAPRAQDDESAQDIFRDYISGPVVQSRCVNCHVEGGVSGHTRLVLVRSTQADHEALNLRAFENLLDAVEDGGGVTYVLNKIQGVSHGGGVQVPAGSADFVNMEWFLGLLDGSSALATVALTPDTLFDTVRLAPDWKTLRRAALIFAGRIPTEAEYAAVENGNALALPATIRGLMTGPEFHEFLIRTSNDRLLTDRGGQIISEFALHFVDYTNEAHRRIEAAGGEEDRAFQEWQRTVLFGVRRAPLELIAHVVQNDRPYTEILTADYIMANPWAAAAYGASTRFSDAVDPYEFRPSRIARYYRIGEGFNTEDTVNGPRVIDPGPLITDYPHAGILNTNAFLYRYPTTATNRNRARARWTYYHFLGLDVEKSASRTTDPVALADTNNPTLNNPACTVCHSILDPVAGAFQNYSDEGYYKINWGGVDSLDDLYKNDAGDSLSVHAESWKEREVLTWSMPFSAGVETLRVMFTNPFNDGHIDRRINLDRLDVTDGQGRLLASQEFEDLEPPVAHWGKCGEAEHSPVAERRDHLSLWGGYHECAIFIDVEIPASGVYNVEIVGWSNGRFEQPGTDGFAKLSVLTDGYEYGDTWYNDMRTPGFDGDSAPDSDNSVQWLARQIVADPRFAEAAVKFWWPAIMGSEVAETPDDARDADFKGRLLAANAQGAEVKRLASEFRRGFRGSPYTYNLKDLLVEIVLSKWFRADAVGDPNPVRRMALRDAGARRLLTPEELARKTAAITGIQWGRYIPDSCCNQWNRSRLTDDYRLLYGGIDSDGITKRARDLTSVVAGVAKRHAVQVGCSVVGRELYLLPDADRRLFAGINPDVTAANAVKGKLVELHDKLFGIQVTPDSPDVEAAHQLFADVMQRRRTTGDDWFNIWDCGFWEDIFFFEGILDDIIVEKENEDGYWYYGFDDSRSDDFIHGTDFSDPYGTAQAWAVVLTAMLMDYRYLYL